MPSFTVEEGQTSRPIRLQYGGKVTITASASGYGYVEYTTDEEAAIGNMAAIWTEWPAGAAAQGGSQTDYSYTATFMRAICTDGTLTVSVGEATQPGAAFDEPWRSLLPFKWRDESLGAIEKPSGFDFDWSYFPWTLSRARDGDIVIPGFDPESLIPYNIIGTTNLYYVDINAANDTGAGTSWATAKKGIDAMLAAASYPCIINVRGSLGGLIYDQANSWNASTPGGTCWVRAVGGKVISAISWQSTLSFSLDEGTTYTATRSNVTTVMDMVNLTSDNEWTALTYVATKEECREAPGTWSDDSLNTSVWVNRSDGVAVTVANTMGLISGVANGKTPTSGDIYVSGIEFVGGNNGAFTCDGNASGKAYFVDCGFKWGGRSSAPRDGLRALEIDAVYAIQCNASNNSKDGFYAFPTGSAVPVLVTIDCVGRNNGVSPSTSNNGWTLHGGSKGLDIKGVYERNYGGNVAITNDGTQSWCVGTVSRESYGDISFGGTFPPTNWQVLDTGSSMWLTLCAGAGSTRDFAVSTNCFLFYRDYTWQGGSRNGGVAF